MVVMIFVAAFVLRNGTLCISERRPVKSYLPWTCLLKQEVCSLCHPRVLGVPLVHLVVHSLCALSRSQSVRHGITCAQSL